jgi:hypothetical protein
MEKGGVFQTGQLIHAVPGVDKPDQRLGSFVRRAAAIFFKFGKALFGIFFGKTIGFFQLAKKLIPLAVGESDVVIAQAAPCFLDFAAKLIESAFDLILVHFLSPPYRELRCAGLVKPAYTLIGVLPSISQSQFDIHQMEPFFSKKQFSFLAIISVYFFVLIKPIFVCFCLVRRLPSIN